MGGIMKLSSKTIAYASAFAAMYIVVTVYVSPISYGPVQLRIANLLNAVVLLNPAFALGIALGVGISDLFSPFGIWDWGVMPFITLGAGLITWCMRAWPVPAIVLNAILISIGVTIFPLGQGGGIPFFPTVLFVALPLIVVELIGYILIWRRTSIHNLIDSGH
jgi:uncharacterized membrane protein